MTDDPMLRVTVASLTRAADRIDRTRPPRGQTLASAPIPALRRDATSAQLRTAARLLDAAEPSRITHRNGRRVNEPAQPRPGWLIADPDRRDVLLLQIGVLGPTTAILPDGTETRSGR